MARSAKRSKASNPLLAALVAERKTLRSRLAALDQSSDLKERRDLSGDNTPAADVLDTVQEALGTEQRLTARTALVRRLTKLGLAEERMREGTYGICEGCGDPIPAARLRAVPEASLCVLCADRDERDSQRPRRRRP